MKKSVFAALLSLSLLGCLNTESGSNGASSQTNSGTTLSMNKEYAMSFGDYENKVFKFTMTKPGLLRVESLKDFAGQVGIEILNSDSVAIGSSYTNLYLPLKAGEYYARFKSGSSALSAKYQLSIDSVDVSEFNNDAKSSTKIEFGTPIRAKLLPATDIDRYTFTLSEPTTLFFRLDSIPTNLSLDAELYDAEQSRLSAISLTKGLDTAVIGYQLKAGTFTFLLQEHLKSNSSDKPFKISLNKYLVDTLEYNNDLASAKTIQLGQPFKGNIWPAGDVDLYKIQIPDTGSYLLMADSISSKITLEYSILDNEGTELSGLTLGSGIGRTIKWTKTGTYYIRLKSYYSGDYGEKLHTVMIKKN